MQPSKCNKILYTLFTSILLYTGDKSKPKTAFPMARF